MRYFHSAFFISAILFLCFNKNVYSQKLSDMNIVKESKNSLHTLDLKNYISDSTNKKSTSNLKFQMKKKPWKAVLYSAILPGAGQFYNESYWKIPVIGVLGGYFVYELVRNNNKYIQYKTEFANSQSQQDPSGDPQLQSLREFYRDQRDNFIIYSMILYVVNLIDAYVDAQLYDFDVSDKIKLGLLQKNNFLKLSYNF